MLSHTAEQLFPHLFEQLFPHVNEQVILHKSTQLPFVQLFGSNAVLLPGFGIDVDEDRHPLLQALPQVTLQLVPHELPQLSLHPPLQSPPHLLLHPFPHEALQPFPHTVLHELSQAVTQFPVQLELHELKGPPFFCGSTVPLALPLHPEEQLIPQDPLQPPKQLSEHNPEQAPAQPVSVESYPLLFNETNLSIA